MPARSLAVLAGWLVAAVAAAEIRTIAVDEDGAQPPADVQDDAADSPRQAEADGAVALPDMVVVATRTRRAPAQLAEAVERIDADQIRALGATRLGAVLDAAQGVSLAGGPRAGGTQLNIRGLSGTRVLMLVDGARQNFDGGHRSRLLLDPELLETVEILRGPASAVWGSDALGGVVALTTRGASDLLAPGRELGARLTVQTSSASGELARGGSVFGRLGDTGLLAYGHVSQWDDLRQGGGARLPHSAGAARGSLLKLDRAFGASELALSHQQFVLEEVSPSNPANPLSDTNPLLDRENRQGYTSLQYGFSREVADAGFAGASLVLYRSGLHIVEDRVDEPRHDELRFATVGGSVQTGWQQAPGLLWTIGAEHYRDDGRASRNGQPRPQFPDAERASSGAFVQLEWQAGPWRITPGLRHDRYRGAVADGSSEPVRASRTTGKLSVAWEPVPELTVFASYAGGFRAPSMLESFARGQHFLGNDFRPNPDLRPERADQFELGLRVDRELAPGLRLTGRIGAHRMQVRDFIETVVVVETEGPVPPPEQCLPPSPAVGCINRNEDGSANPFVPPVFVGGYTTSENLERARIAGADAALRLVIGGITAAVDYSRLRGENLENSQPLLSIPNDELRAQLAMPLGPVTLGLRHRHGFAQDRVPRAEDGTPLIPPTPSYDVTDLSLHWQPVIAGRVLRIDAGVDNLADRNWRPHLSNFAYPGRSLRAAVAFDF